MNANPANTIAPVVSKAPIPSVAKVWRDGAALGVEVSDGDDVVVDAGSLPLSSALSSPTVLLLTMLLRVSSET